MSITSNIKINGIEVVVEFNTSKELATFLSEVSGKAPAAPALKEVGKTKPVRKYKKTRIDASDTPITEEEILVAIQVARAAGPNKSSVSNKIAESILALGTAHPKRQLTMFGYRLYAYMDSGKNHGISAKNMSILNAHGVRAGELAAGFLGHTSDYRRQVEVRQA